jgi:integrase
MGLLIQCPICKRKYGPKKRKCKPCGEDLIKAKRSRRVKYWISYRMPDGRQRRESVASFKDLDPYSKADAEIALSKRGVQKREKRILDMLPESMMTFNELAEWYLDLESVKGLKSYDTVCIYINKFNRTFGNTLVDDIKPADLDELQAKRRQEEMKAKTIDNELHYIKTMVFKGFYNDKLSGDALRVFRRVKRLLKGHANARDRIMDIGEFNRLLDKCPRHLKDILNVAYWSGMRKGEITSLTWEKIELKNRMIRLEAADTKEGKAKSVPMSTAVYKTFKAIPVGLHDPHVFLYYGKRITRNFSQGLKSACKKAGITWGRDVKGGFIFHDLRHTFITDMRRAGVDRTVRMAITGHAITDMDQRYDVVEDADKLAAIKRLENYRLMLTENASGDQVVTKEGI